MQDREYLTVMIQSLEKKKSILDRIIEKNREQRVLFTEEDSDPEILEQNMQEKSRSESFYGKVIVSALLSLNRGAPFSNLRDELFHAFDFFPISFFVLL